MLSEIKEICDRLVALLQYRAKQRRDFFDDTIEPIFKQLSTVHEDYMRGIRETLMLIEANIESPQMIRAELDETQSKLRHIRRLTTAMVRPLLADTHSPDPDEQTAANEREATFVFAYSVFWYFFPDVGVDFPSGLGSTCEEPLNRLVASYYTILAGLIDEFMVGGSTPSEIKQRIRSLRDQLDTRWDNVASAYSQLRSFCYGYAT